jgi:hypothetical protein
MRAVEALREGVFHGRQTVRCCGGGEVVGEAGEDEHGPSPGSWRLLLLPNII